MEAIKNKFMSNGLINFSFNENTKVVFNLVQNFVFSRKFCSKLKQNFAFS